MSDSRDPCTNPHRIARNLNTLQANTRPIDRIKAKGKLCAWFTDINVPFAVIFTIPRKETLTRELPRIRPSRSYPTTGPARYAALRRVISKSSPEIEKKTESGRKLRMEENLRWEKTANGGKKVDAHKRD
jgi:hypothetical protein